MEGAKRTRHVSRYILRRSMGMDWGTTYHDYDVDTNLGMVSFISATGCGEEEFGISKEDRGLLGHWLR